MIHDFIKQFTEHRFEGIVKKGKEFFLINKGLQEFESKIDLDPFASGLFLGKQRGKIFRPTPALLDLIAKQSTKKVFINDKAEWLFICENDVFGKSIIKANKRRGLCLVQNRIDENLGYGKFVAPLDKRNLDKMVIKNILDKGEYLRMER
ncbi:MAG: hypothetical protein U9R08_00670 [Nanoarchaeota archaeon]|nr:hypothetical protein [Nanoarchaeota archaeon]